MVMRLEKAHPAAFQESIFTLCTNRLWKKVEQAVDAAPLPSMGVYLTGEAYSWWRREWTNWPWFPLKTSKALLRLPKGWSQQGDYAFNVGRKNRRLVLKLSIDWEWNNLKEYYKYIDDYNYRNNEDEEVDNEGNWWRKFYYFTTNVEIFPLTTQQAILLNTKQFGSKSYPIFWGTKEDVEEIELKYPYARG